MPNQSGTPLVTERPRIVTVKDDKEEQRLLSVIEDAAHFSELGHDVSRFLRERMAPPSEASERSET